MKNIAYYNGKTAPIEEMMVPMNDRACYFGDGRDLRGEPCADGL